MGEGVSQFAISLGALALALFGICAASYCSYSPRARKAKREREEFQRSVREMELRTLQRNEELQEAQSNLAAKRIIEDGRVEYKDQDHTETAPASTSTSGQVETERGVYKEYINY